MDSQLAHKRNGEEGASRQPAAPAPTPSKEHAARKAAAAAAAAAATGGAAAAAGAEMQKQKQKQKQKQGLDPAQTAGGAAGESADFVVYDLLDADHVASGEAEGEAGAAEAAAAAAAQQQQAGVASDVGGEGHGEESVAGAVATAGSSSKNGAGDAGNNNQRANGAGGADVMSHATDSIISLPPMEDSTAGQTRWHTLKAEAQEARARKRRSSFAGTGGVPPRRPPSSASAATNQAYASPQRRKREIPVQASGPAVASASPLAAGAVPIAPAAAAAAGISLHVPQPQPMQPAEAIVRQQQQAAVRSGASSAASSPTPPSSSSPQLSARASPTTPAGSPSASRPLTPSASATNLTSAAPTGAAVGLAIASAGVAVSGPGSSFPATAEASSADGVAAEPRPATKARPAGPAGENGERVGVPGALHAAQQAHRSQRGHRRRASMGQRSMNVYPDGQSGLDAAMFEQRPLLPRTESVGGSGVLMYGAAGGPMGPGSEYDASSSYKGSNHGSARSRRYGKRSRDAANVYPHSWEWRRPADEDVIIPNGAWIYLALIGWCTFGVAFVVNLVSGFLSVQVTGFVADTAVGLFGAHAKQFALAAIRSTFLVISFLSAWKLSPKFTSGSGIPEMKCVLSGVFMPAALGGWTLSAKIVGLIFALSSSVSIGRLGPFIHISGICAALISRIPWFSHLSSSARFQLQAVSCAMAAGVGATFGAPIGGAMLAIELMSTYYYIHWLPMALYCSIMGYYLSAAVTPVDAQAYFYASVSIGLENESVLKLFTYAFLGVVCGVVGAALVQYTVLMYQIRSRFFTQQTLVRTSIFLAVFAALHSLIVGEFGGVLEEGQRKGVIALFNEKSSPKAWIRHAAEPFDKETTWNSSVSLFTATLIKFLLTGISLILPVPAGTFMPIFEIGALLGRGFGEVFMRFSFVTWIDPRATAIVGAAGVAAGTLHITSIAVVMLEITREAVDILPLALGVIVSYGVSKHLCSDLFSELIKIRRLPFILGLRERYPKENRIFYERVASVSAKNFMSKEFPYVTPMSTIGDIKWLLAGGKSSKGTRWGTCAFLNNESDRCLWGTISRSVLLGLVKEASGANSPAPPPSQGFPSPDSSVAGSSQAQLQDVVSGRDAEVEAAEQELRNQAARDAQLVPMLYSFDPKIGHRMVDEGPMQISSQTPFWKVATYFRMLGLSHMYVTHNGVTVGHLTKIQVIDFTFDEEDRAAEERREEARQARELAELTALARGAKLSGRTGGLTQRGKRMASHFSQQDLLAMARQSVSRKS